MLGHCVAQCLERDPSIRIAIPAQRGGSATQLCGVVSASRRAGSSCILILGFTSDRGDGLVGDPLDRTGGLVKAMAVKFE